ncbi:MAG TPA: GGDEF domain-containing protein [Pyrinomonadaceae bacterium]|jgi:diguanylate cyclase (GGDEF)-like protein|nr:GGDEF domain-containing protein [Pyrinomonadaceae bacterium]
MKHVILLSGGNESPAGGLVNALRDAGISAVTREAAGLEARAESPETNDVAAQTATAPLAVVLDIPNGADMAELHTAVSRAAADWPGTALVACRRDPLEERHALLHRLDTSTLKRLGFHAVADEPAQLASVLRGLELHGTAAADAPEEKTEKGPGLLAPASLLLPEKLDADRLRAAFEMVASLHFAADQKGAAAAALAGLAALVGADRWTIYLLTEAGRGDEALFEPLAARGLTPSERAVPEGDWRRALMGDAMALSGAQSGAAREAAAKAETVRNKEGERQVLAIPLVNGERVIGVLESVREGEGARSFSDPDASLLSALSLPLTAALSNAVRIAEAERLSQTDDLTKLHNARFLRQYLIGELKRARRYGSPVSALFLDLDDFKRVNDQHGHLVGSHVLMEMAAVVLASVRDTDVVARYGGDEFVAILPETAVEQAARVAERVRERIAGHVFTGGRALRLRLTASFGVATFPIHAQSPQQLVASADAAMYEAKAALKNCIRFAAETSEKP